MRRMMIVAAVFFALASCREDDSNTAAPPPEPPPPVRDTIFLETPEILRLGTTSVCYQMVFGDCAYRNEIRVDWAAMMGAVGYRLYRSYSRDSAYTVVYHESGDQWLRSTNTHADTAYFTTTYYPGQTNCMVWFYVAAIGDSGNEIEFSAKRSYFW